MEHTEEPSYLDLLPPELREQVATNILPVIPELPPNPNYVNELEKEVLDHERWIKNTIDHYLQEDPRNVAAIAYRPGEHGRVIGSVLRSYYKGRDALRKQIDDIKMIPIVKHIRKKRNRRVVLKKQHS